MRFLPAHSLGGGVSPFHHVTPPLMRKPALPPRPVQGSARKSTGFGVGGSSSTPPHNAVTIYLKAAIATLVHPFLGRQEGEVLAFAAVISASAFAAASDIASSRLIGAGFAAARLRWAGSRFMSQAPQNHAKVRSPEPIRIGSPASATAPHWTAGRNPAQPVQGVQARPAAGRVQQARPRSPRPWPAPLRGAAGDLRKTRPVRPGVASPNKSST